MAAIIQSGETVGAAQYRQLVVGTLQFQLAGGGVGDIVENHAHVAHGAIGRGQRDQGQVLVHEFRHAGNGTVILEAQQEGALFPGDEGTGLELEHGIQLALEPATRDLREQFEKIMPDGMGG